MANLPLIIRLNILKNWNHVCLKDNQTICVSTIAKMVEDQQIKQFAYHFPFLPTVEVSSEDQQIIEVLQFGLGWTLFICNAL